MITIELAQEINNEIARGKKKFPGIENLTVALMEEVGELASAQLQSLPQEKISGRSRAGDCRRGSHYAGRRPEHTAQRRAYVQGRVIRWPKTIIASCIQETKSMNACVAGKLFNHPFRCVGNFS